MCKYCYTENNGSDKAANWMLHENFEDGENGITELVVGLEKNHVGAWGLYCHKYSSNDKEKGVARGGFIKIKYCPMCGRDLDQWDVIN